MRAINLIPPDERRRGGAGAPARSGLLSYFVLGGLLAVLIGVTALVLTSNQISDRKAEIAQLEQERDAAQARADSLRAFADFSKMEEARAATVTTLAQSRFDWERVLRELALVLPSDVWLVELEGSANPEVQLEDSVEIETRAGAPGPALELVGCAVSQDAVASFAATLREIDGVTRVSVFKSELPDPSDVQETAGEDEGLQADCRTRDFIARFEIVAAFDQAPVPATAGSAAPAPTAPAPAPGETSETPPSGSSAEGTDSSQPASETTPGG